MVVRIETCTSDWINSIYPGDITPTMAPQEINLLRASGHTAVMFNAAKARILPHTVPGEAERMWVPYTVTALELKRLLAEARARGEAFSLTYSVLGVSGDEAWRRHAAGLRRVTVSEDGRGGQRCSVGRVGCSLWLPVDAPWCACEPMEYALQPPPGYWPTKTLVQQPYPILPDVGDDNLDREVTCFGP